MIWHTTRYAIDVSRPKVMGIVNVTPDSFSDGGRANCSLTAIKLAERLVEEGADILDVGGESTRPGAEPVPVEEELDRVRPVLQELVRWSVPISLDTRRATVMQAGLDLGVDIINDVQALRDEGALATLARHGQAGVCLMHMRGAPATMQATLSEANMVAEVKDFLAARVRACLEAGVDRSRIALDPGIGFGKSAGQNLDLLRQQHALAQLGYPLLVGWSRKSTLGVVTGRAVEQRLAASISAALLAVDQGAHVVRVHDVAATVDALKVWAAVRRPD